jgi:hypothetical protein
MAELAALNIQIRFTRICYTEFYCSRFLLCASSRAEGNRINIHIVKSCLLVACLSLAAGYEAQAKPRLPYFAEVISAQQAAQAARAATGGRVLAVRLSGSNYRVKVLIRDGVVRIVYVDARTGRVSG